MLAGFQLACLMYSDCWDTFRVYYKYYVQVYYVFIAVTLCIIYQFLLEAGLLSFVWMPEGWLEVSIQKVL